MIARLIPEAYDIAGRQVGQPSTKHGFRPTFPMASYATQPLTAYCATLEELRAFLRTCRYVSDRRQFHRDDYWMPPEEFEKRRQGDCDCFALWTWRQVLQMGYEARYVVGWNRAGASHAWVTFCSDGQWFLLEPLAARIGPDIPRLRTLAYVPRMSVSWDGEDVRFYEHEDRAYVPPMGQVCRLLGEYIAYEVRYGPRLAFLWCWHWLSWLSTPQEPEERHASARRTVARWFRRLRKRR